MAVFNNRFGCFNIKFFKMTFIAHMHLTVEHRMYPVADENLCMMGRAGETKYSSGLLKKIRQKYLPYSITRINNSTNQRLPKEVLPGPNLSR